MMFDGQRRLEQPLPQTASELNGSKLLLKMQQGGLQVQVTCRKPETFNPMCVAKVMSSLEYACQHRQNLLSRMWIASTVFGD